MKINKYAFIILSALMVNTAFADEMEEVIVSSSLVNSSASEIADPIHILSGMILAMRQLKVWGKP